MTQWKSASLEIEGLWVQVSLRCVLEQGLYINPCLVLVHPRKSYPAMTEKLFTEMYRIKSNKQKLKPSVCTKNKVEIAWQLHQLNLKLVVSTIQRIRRINEPG